MKRRNSLNKSLIATWLGVVLATASSVGWAAPPNQSQNPPYTLPEYNAFKTGSDEKNAEAKIKLLDNFTAKFPDSALMPNVYIDYYQSYFSLQNYPQAVAYADMLLALADKVDPAVRLGALVTRALAYAVDCDDRAFQTPEASVKAMAAAAQGLQLLSQLPTFSSPASEQFAAAKVSYEMIFDSAAKIAELSVKGDPVACAPTRPPQSSAGGQFVPGRRFDLIIQHILREQRQSPVR